MTSKRLKTLRSKLEVLKEMEDRYAKDANIPEGN